MPMTFWWFVGGLAVALYGAAASWVAGASIDASAYVTPLLAVGFALGTAAVGALAIAVEVRRSRQPAMSELDRA
jgi:hypothetical protein